ncbi:hypothetical protein C475_06695 [Halosimplex carlsbadense 2-9-1]|uniref:Uncharacterized protein n=1 Tax=Halosimplex carlsbadense 2-9-1 TaxID=797114 RepID=M0CYU1_9EURY|nr:hypothetical protein [Halosimplex carlsbadense]ELZ27587.1 hypothetical protein C475_06695 [Halosimplex carlsbadense 2-9-1]
MTFWTRVTFDPGERSVDEVEGQLRTARDDPETERRDGAVVWKAREEVEGDTLTDLGVEAERALVIDANDTAMAGDGTLYEFVDGAYVPVDAMNGGEIYLGRDVVAYVQREHGFVGVER